MLGVTCRIMARGVCTPVEDPGVCIVAAGVVLVAPSSSNPHCLKAVRSVCPTPLSVPLLGLEAPTSNRSYGIPTHSLRLVPSYKLCIENTNKMYLNPGCKTDATGII